MPESTPRPVMLVILDGWGIRDAVADNAVHQARTPVFDALMRERPWAQLRTFGADVGLVAATRHYEGPPVWLVTGATGAGVRAAAEALDPADLRDHYAVASEAGTVMPLPLRSGSR